MVCPQIRDRLAVHLAPKLFANKLYNIQIVDKPLVLLCASLDKPLALGVLLMAITAVVRLHRPANKHTQAHRHYHSKPDPLEFLAHRLFPDIVFAALRRREEVVYQADVEIVKRRFRHLPAQARFAAHPLSLSRFFLE
jgi:hypothetical protein